MVGDRSMAPPPPPVKLNLTTRHATRPAATIPAIPSRPGKVAFQSSSPRSNQQDLVRAAPFHARDKTAEGREWKARTPEEADELRLHMKEAERSGNCSRKEAPWSAQYLPADNGEEERRVRMKWLGQEIADVLEREVVRGCRQGEEAEAGVKVGGTENLVGSASDDLGMDLKRSKKVFVQSSLFAGVMLNIQHKYGVDVGFVLEKLYPRDASKGQLQDLGMSGLQATGDQGDAAKAVPSTGEISAYQAGAVTNILDAGSMSGGQMRTRAQEEIQSMMSHWEKQYPGILSGKGRHLLSIDLQLMDDLEPMALRQLGLWDWDQSERQLTQVFGADLEMEAGRRRRCQQVFRGLDGSREILKMEDK